MAGAKKVFVGLGLCLFLLSGTVPAFALQQADQVARIGRNENSVLSNDAAILGSFEVVGDTAGGNVTFWDSPDGTPTHAQAVVIAEAGVTADRSSFASGPINRLTRYGLFVETNNCQVVVQYGD